MAFRFMNNKITLFGACMACFIGLIPAGLISISAGHSLLEFGALFTVILVVSLIVSAGWAVTEAFWFKRFYN